MRRGAVRERWCGRKRFVRSQKGAGVHQGKGGQQDPHHDPQYTGLSWQVLPRDSAQRGEKLLPLLVPALGGGGAELSFSRVYQKPVLQRAIRKAPGQLTFHMRQHQDK